MSPRRLGDSWRGEGWHQLWPSTWSSPGTEGPGLQEGRGARPQAVVPARLLPSLPQGPENKAASR